MYSDIFIHSTNNGFWVGAIVKSGAMNNVVNIFQCIAVFISVGYIAGSVS